MFTEQQIINYLHFIIRNVLGIFIYFVFITGLLTPKYNKWLTIGFLTVLSTIMYCIVGDKNAYVSFITLALFMITAAFTLYKDKKRYCAFAVSYFFVIMLVSDTFISALLLYVYGYYPQKSDDFSWETVICDVIIEVYIIIILGFCILLWNKLMRRQSIKSMGMFLLFPLSQVFFIATFAKGTWENNELYVYSEPLLIVSIIISVIADVVMYFALKDNSNMNSMRKRLKEIENEMEQQLKYYDALADKYTEIREYRHDILNLISISEIMQEKKLSETESKAYINEMKKKAEAMEVPIYCSSPLVNAVLWQKQQAAEKSGIEFTTDIEPGENFPIDRIDICSLMVNLADNALRECENCEKPFVEIEVSRKINMLFISVKNSCGKLNSKKTNKLHTTKSGDHGYGMEIINKIAKKYNGEFAFSTENGTASASVMLEISQ